MANTLRWFAVVASLAASALLAAPLAAHAQTVPIRLSYEGTFTPPSVVSFVPLIVSTTDTLAGEGSHLGSFTGVYPHEVNFDARTFAGTATFTAANGDLLYI